MLSTQEAAEKLTSAGFSYTAEEVANLAKLHVFPGAPKDARGFWQIPQEDIDFFIRRQKQAKRLRWITTGSILVLLTILFAAISGTKDALDLIKDYILPKPEVRTTEIRLTATPTPGNTPKSKRANLVDNIALVILYEDGSGRSGITGSQNFSYAKEDRDTRLELPIKEVTGAIFLVQKLNVHDDFRAISYVEEKWLDPQMRVADIRKDEKAIILVGLKVIAQYKKHFGDDPSYYIPMAELSPIMKK